MIYLKLLLAVLSASISLVNHLLQVESPANGGAATKSPIKRLNTFGVWVAFALLASMIVQLFLDNQEERLSSAQRASDSTAIVNLTKSLTVANERLDATYRQGENVLARTDSSLRKQTSLGDSVGKSFAAANETFRGLIAQSTTILNPLAPLVLGFHLRIPFSNPAIARYLARIRSARNAAVRSGTLERLVGSGAITWRPDYSDANTGRIDYESTVIQLEADSLSDLFIDPKRDGTAATLLDPAFSIDFYRDRPRSDGTSRAYVSLMTGRVTWRPGPDYGTRQRIAVDFRRKSVELDVFYQMEMEPSKDLSGGLNSLEGSFMSVHSFQLDSLFEIDSMYVFPQAIPTRFSVLSFQRAERTVDCSFSCTDSGLGTHGYVRRIAVGELTGNAQRLH